MMAQGKSRHRLIRISVLVLIVVGLYLLSGPLLRAIGGFLILDELPRSSEGVVVLHTGVDYYPRLMEAARLYKAGLVERVVIDGNRKSEALRQLERKGFKPCCPWYEDRMRMLELMGVPREDVIAVSAEDAYDTVSEARAVGQELLRLGWTRIIVTTSKFHTRRAHFVWQEMYEGEMVVDSAPARCDPFDPKNWWRSGRQIRWVLSEYGAWIYDLWKRYLSS